MTDKSIPEKGFSKEYLFYHSLIRNKALGVTFKEGSKAARDYGDHVTISMKYSDEEIDLLGANYNKGIDTYGNVAAEVLVERLTPEQKELIKTEGFNTDEILQVIIQ